MQHTEKYARGYFMPPTDNFDWVKKEYIDHAPAWCSVDLRDGNQALVVPMNLEEKVELYKLLLRLGFKEIEVGFPAASETEYDFLRTLIDQNLIPPDVTIQVLTQARPHIIKKTFDALDGIQSPVVVHLYNSTSVAQRQQVFQKSPEEIIQIAVDGAKLLQEYAAKYTGDFRFEYSPESFTGTEMEFALRICNAVLDVWKPTKEKPVIINLPVTVQLSMPHVYACQVEYMSKNLNYRDSVILSLHPHNDRGCGIADTELGLLAGGQRVEGTLFGNGERTGNADIVTLALNLFSHGVDPQLNFEHMPDVVDMYERLTGMPVYERQPYGGKLVFAAFSGSHQDAIAKGMKWRESHGEQAWNVPYLLIDPKDIGREYDGDVIRINSQSGKGGIGYLLEQKFGYNLPKNMREDLGYTVKSISDHAHKELQPQEIHDIFVQHYVNVATPVEITDFHFRRNGTYHAEVSMTIDGKSELLCGEGNGRLDAIADALKKRFDIAYTDLSYSEHALEVGSKSRAAAYVGITVPDGKTYWGCGVHTDIINASVYALLSATNKLMTAQAG